MSIKCQSCQYLGVFAATNCNMSSRFHSVVKLPLLMWCPLANDIVTSWNFGQPWVWLRFRTIFMFRVQRNLSWETTAMRDNLSWEPTSFRQKVLHFSVNQPVTKDHLLERPYSCDQWGGLSRNVLLHLISRNFPGNGFIIHITDNLTTILLPEFQVSYHSPGLASYTYGYYCNPYCSR